MKTRYMLLGLLAAMLSFGALAGDKVYKWKDANGVTHFTDTPPPKGTQFDDLRLKGGTTVAAAPEEAKPAEADVAAKASGDAAKSRCEQARTRLALLEGPTDLTTMQEGKPVVMSKEARASETSVAKSQVQNYCAATDSNGG
jgi:hypothetical protein